jgi:pentatricopeptide repeat protein
LTIRVLDAMKDTHDTEGNLVTFNIALKRLAKQGNTMACEGILIGMLQSGVEPSVVSYTTAIAACVADPKRSDIAAEWLNRMRSRRVQPNVITYNTALASCLDGTLEATIRASSIASEMLADIKEQLDRGVVVRDQYTNIIPNFYTKTLGRKLMIQLKSNWDSGAVDKKIAKSTLRVPLLQLVEFQNTETAGFAKKQAELVMEGVKSDDEDQIDATAEVEEELEFSTALRTHRAAAV